MILRIFSENSVKDIDISGSSSFTIGSSADSDLQVSDAAVKGRHFTIKKQNGAFLFSGEGKIVKNDSVSTGGYVTPHDVFQISRNTSIYVLQNYGEKIIADIGENTSVTIGRNEENSIRIVDDRISRYHAMIEKKGGRYHIIDLKSTNGTYLNGKQTTESELNPGDTIVAGFIRIVFNGDQLIVEPENCPVSVNITHRQYRDFTEKTICSKAPRIREQLPNDRVIISAPPATSEKPEINWLSTLLPALVSIAVAILVSVSFNSSVTLYFTVPTVLAGLVVSIVNYYNKDKNYSKRVAEVDSSYSSYLAEQEEKLQALNESQLEILQRVNPTVKESMMHAAKLDGLLWPRSISDEDFLSVRIGTGSVPGSYSIETPRVPAFSEDVHLKKACELAARYSAVPNAPITADLRNAVITGVAGSRDLSIPFARNLIVSLTALHSYDDLKLVIICRPEDIEAFRFAEVLPHCRDNSRRNTYLAASPAQAKVISESFASEFRRRQQKMYESRHGSGKPVFQPFVLFIVVEPEFLPKKDNPLSEFLSFGSSSLGLGAVTFSGRVSDLPAECGAIIELSGSDSRYYMCSSANTSLQFSPDRAESDDNYSRYGQSLSNVYLEEAYVQGIAERVPAKYSFYDMFGITSPRDWDLKRAWANADVSRSISAPVGISESGIISLDIHESAQGPHGLGAGTSGSGKSEFIQSYVLSVAMNYSPEDVGFVLIDFKGGGMASQLRGLPHIMGVITDIDEDSIDRSLKSINAEVRRREKIFKDCGVNSIESYHELFRCGRASVPLPCIIVIADEFAELKRIKPDFMKDFISASQKGRSLGVHLILTTQNPSGVISQDIFANANFRFCLKVLDPSASKELVGSPLAADIQEPGRGYLMANNGELFTLFQSGYSGALTPSGKTQLRECVDYISAYCRENGIEKLPEIYLPPLPGNLEFTDDGQNDGLITVGLIDAPERRSQEKYRIDIFEKNTLVIGSPLSGKTNFLQTVIRQLSVKYTPDDVNIYIIDYASGALKLYERFCTVGGVVIKGENEKLRSLIRLLHQEIERRKRLFFEASAGSYDLYLEYTGRSLPRIVVIIDNLTSLIDLSFADSDDLMNLIQNGISFGISFVVSNSRALGIGSKYLSFMENRIALHCSNSDEINYMFEGRKKTVPDIPGRCLVEGGNYECQLYNAAVGHGRVSDELFSLAETLNTACGGKKAVPIPVIPETLPFSVFSAALPVFSGYGTALSVGLDYDTVAPATLDLSGCGIFAVSGRKTPARDAFIKYLVTGPNSADEGRLEYYILDGIGRSLSGLSGAPGVRAYAFLPDRIKEALEAVDEELSARYDRLLSDETVSIGSFPHIMLIINGAGPADAIGDMPDAVKLFGKITGRYKSLGVTVVLSDLENAPISFGSPEAVRKIKDEKNVFFFDSISSLKLFDLPFSVAKANRMPLSEGDCFMIRDGSVQRIKVITADQ